MKSVNRKTSSAQYKEQKEMSEFLQLPRWSMRDQHKAKFKTKVTRKAARTSLHQEHAITPDLSDRMLVGYMRIMNFLSRGCDVKAA